MRLLEANGYHHGMLWPRGEQWALSLYTMPYGIPAFSWSSSGAPVVNWENPKYQQGIAFALDQWCMHDLPSVKLGNRAIGLFKSDEPENGMPMFVDIINTYSKLPILAPEIDGNWDILPWPKADDGNEYNVMGGTSYAIFSKSRHKREAFEWLKYLNRLESQQRIILERANRGENSVFTLSPVMAVWGPENASFWQRPELAKSKRLIEVMSGVVKTFGTIESVHGALDAGRLEQHLIDRAQMLATKELNDTAQRHGISRWELIQAFAQGKFSEDKQAIDNRMQDLIHNEYKTIAVEAQGIITRETKYYDQRFGNVINELEDYEKRFDILSYVKAFVVTLLCAFTALVLLYRPMRTRYISYLFISLPLFLVAVFTFVPAITALALSFTEYHPVLPLSSAKWCALKQYTDILQSGELLDCISRTLLYIVLTLPVTMTLSLLLSSLLNNKLRGERFWRFIYFSPLVTSAISVSLIFTQIYAGTASGWLNALGLKVGLLSDPVDWLNEESTFLYCVILLAIWGGLPFQTLIFLAGLQQVPKQLYESAALDGAGWVRQFWNISLPSLRPQILFVAITGVIGGFQVFETIFMLAGGTGDAKLGFGPNDAGMTMVPLVYYNGFEVFKMGRASAVACVLFVLILVLTMLQFRFFADKKAEQ